MSLGVLVVLGLLVYLFLLGSDARQRRFLNSIGVSRINRKKWRELQAQGASAAGVIDDIRVIYPLRRSGSQWAPVVSLFGDHAGLEDLDADPIAIYLLYEFEIQHEGRPRSFRGARHFGGKGYEAAGKVGQKVTVRYLPSDPTVSVIEP